jgi:hypothetical protein
MGSERAAWLQSRRGWLIGGIAYRWYSGNVSCEVGLEREVEVSACQMCWLHNVSSAEERAVVKHASIESHIVRATHERPAQAKRRRQGEPTDPLKKEIAEMKVVGWPGTLVQEDAFNLCLAKVLIRTSSSEMVERIHAVLMALEEDGSGRLCRRKGCSDSRRVRDLLLERRQGRAGQRGLQGLPLRSITKNASDRLSFL